MGKCHICSAGNTRMRRFKDHPVVLCDRCHRLARRRFSKFRGRTKQQVPVPSRGEWVDALAKSWDVKQRAFVCGITGVRLDPDNPNSPRYPTQEHVVPGSASGGWMVIAGAVNDMKSDLSMEEFRKAISLVAACLGDEREQEHCEQLGTLFDNLEHWKRV